MTIFSAFLSSVSCFRTNIHLTYLWGICVEIFYVQYKVGLFSFLSFRSVPFLFYFSSVFMFSLSPVSLIFCVYFPSLRVFLHCDHGFKGITDRSNSGTRSYFLSHRLVW